jgi:hypothetical protein
MKKRLAICTLLRLGGVIAVPGAAVAPAGYPTDWSIDVFVVCAAS